MASQVLTISTLLLSTLCIHKIKQNNSRCKAKRSLNRVRKSSLGLLFCSEAIDNNFNRVLFLFFKLWNIGELNNFTINSSA